MGRNQEHQKTKKFSPRKEKEQMKGPWNNKRTNKGQTRSSYSLLPNFLAMMGRTSSASAKDSKNGSMEIKAQSDGSSNQLLIGIPLFTCNLKT